ncbi:MAG TPA: hypothetical protein VHB45_10490 [Alloacidobacterium sp.]|nr:hypothetical protein [Alloacidobacterium sp.]
MNQYIFLHRIQGPVMILTVGIAALLDQWHILSFGRSWPLYLIVLGVLKLAQRAALMHAEPPPGYPQQQGYTGYAPVGGAPPASSSTAIVPADSGFHSPANRTDDSEGRR